MADVIKFPGKEEREAIKKKESDIISADDNELDLEAPAIVFCGVCESVDFSVWVDSDEKIFFVCSNEDCGEVFYPEDIEEDE